MWHLSAVTEDRLAMALVVLEATERAFAERSLSPAAVSSRPAPVE